MPAKKLPLAGKWTGSEGEYVATIKGTTIVWPDKSQKDFQVEAGQIKNARCVGEGRETKKTDGSRGCGFGFLLNLFCGGWKWQSCRCFEEIFWVIAHGILQNLRLENSHGHILWLIWIHRFDQFKVMLT